MNLIDLVQSNNSLPSANSLFSLLNGKIDLTMIRQMYCMCIYSVRSSYYRPEQDDFYVPLWDSYTVCITWSYLHGAFTGMWVNNSLAALNLQCFTVIWSADGAVYTLTHVKMDDTSHFFPLYKKQSQNTPLPYGVWVWAVVGDSHGI